MNWKIIFQLSLLGLIMAFATVFLLPEKISGIAWLPIFIFCAYVIARTCQSKHFLNGFMVSIFNCFWITSVHLILYKQHAALNPDMVQSMPHIFANHPRLDMGVMGLVIGVISGLILGLFAFIASKIVKPRLAV